MQSKLIGNSPAVTRTQRARREDIISAAITVINQDGYASSSIDKIAKEAGTNKSTVLYHFGSKDALNKAIVGTLFEDGAAYMGTYIVAAHTYSDKLRAYITSNLQFISEHVEHIAAVHQIQKNTIPVDNDEALIWLEKMLKEGQLTKDFGKFDPGTIAMIIRLVIDNASFYIISHPALDVDVYAHEIVQMFDKVTRPDSDDTKGDNQ